MAKSDGFSPALSRPLRATCAGLTVLFLLFAAAPAQAGDGVLVRLPGGAIDGGAAWGDYDNDGDLDLVISGTGASGQRVTTFYRSKRDTLEPWEVGLPRAAASSLDWGDYDNDGYLDLLLTGMVGFGSQGILGTAVIYHNVPDPADPGERAFVLAPAALPNIYQGQGAWVDYNKDGRLDLLLTGCTDGGQPFTGLFRSRPAGFEPVDPQATGFAALCGGGVAWGDFNGDNFPDLALYGRDASGTARTLVYPNLGGSNFAAPLELTGVWGGSATWIDADGDDDLDLLVTGNQGDNLSNIQPSTILYQNEGGALLPVEESGLPPLWRSSASAADYDGDGDADLLLSGLSEWERVMRIYINQGDLTFTDAQAGLPDAAGLSVAWGDFNGDRAPDAALSGVFGDGDYITLVLQNPYLPGPTPAAPQLEAACWDGRQGVTFAWEPTGAPGLTYNLRLGSTPGGAELLHPQASLITGERRLAKPGGASTGPTEVFQALDFTSPGTLKWAVQAVDAGLAGGPFSAEAQFPYGEHIAFDDAFTTMANTPLALVNLLGNDNAAFAPLRIYSYTQPAHGQLTLEKDGLTYTPDLFWSGVDHFTYQSLGAGLYCTQAEVTITVSAPDTPLALACAQGCGGYTPGALTAAVSMSEDGAPLPFALSLRADDPGADEPLNWQVSAAPAHGTAGLAPSTLPGEENAVQYAPPADWSGVDAFTVSVSDPYGSQAQFTVTVQVLPVNDLPTLDVLPDLVTQEWSGTHLPALTGISAGPEDEAGQPLTVSVVTDRPDLLRDLRVVSPDEGGWALRYRVAEGTGTAQVTVTVDDGQAENAVTSQIFLVTVVNGPRVYLPLAVRP